jgi:PRTRC genetic system ThiF family protein
VTVEHLLPARYLERPVDVTLVGCGGNGSQMLTGLARLDRAMRALGHPGFSVEAWDHDHVTEANVGRQLFSPADVGTNKAVVLVNRVNAFYGLGWKGRPESYNSDDKAPAGGFLVTCVDTAAARLEISRSAPYGYWLDLGNREADGQVVLGEIGATRRFSIQQPRLPTIVDLFSELEDPARADDDGPSCSLAEALERQELFINQAVVTQALALLWMLFRFGRVSWHGSFVNLRTGRTQPLPVDPAAWARMGYHQSTKKGRRPK